MLMLKWSEAGRAEKWTFWSAVGTGVLRSSVVPTEPHWYEVSRLARFHFLGKVVPRPTAKPIPDSTVSMSSSGQLSRQQTIS